VLIVVGGNSRGAGKTLLVASLIRTLPEFDWTAVKISHHEARGYCLTQESDAAGNGDSSRYLAAGARRAYWLRAAPGELAAALPDLCQLIVSSPHVILESNRILEFFQPDLYLFVVDPATPNFKESARRYFDRADAFVALNRGVLPLLPSKPVFRVDSLATASPALIAFIRAPGCHGA
jgi:hypothetical protein